MGYDAHITRRAHWADEDGADTDDITFADWNAEIQGDDGEVCGLDGTPLPDMPATQKHGWFTRLFGR